VIWSPSSPFAPLFPVPGLRAGGLPALAAASGLDADGSPADRDPFLDNSPS
jgi:hypothetical protein